MMRQELSEKIRVLVESLESDLTVRVLNETNLGLQRDPKEPRLLLRKLLISKMGTWIFVGLENIAQFFLSKFPARYYTCIISAHS